MNSKQKTTLSAFGALILAAVLVVGFGVDPLGLVISEPAASERAVATTSATVLRVVDGDTIEVLLPPTALSPAEATAESVRLIGIDTPEITWPDEADAEPTGECFAFVARDFLQDKLAGATVELVGDPRQPARDSYDRRLSYVYQNGELINEILIKKGYARELSVGSGYEKVDDFQALEREAQENRRGRWGVCQ
jgi:micrococcal nuclease